MFEQLKKIAVQKLTERMQGNALFSGGTEAVAEEGAGSIVDLLKSKITGGGLGDVTSLFSNDGKSTESNPIFSLIKDKLMEIFVSKGVSSDVAGNEAKNIGLGLIDDLKEKFLSKDSADSAFDLTNIAGMLGGDGDSLLDKAKNLF